MISGDRLPGRGAGRRESSPHDQFERLRPDLARPALVQASVDPVSDQEYPHLTL